MDILQRNVCFSKRIFSELSFLLFQFSPMVARFDVVVNPQSGFLLVLGLFL
jgi:hypothetical protein